MPKPISVRCHAGYRGDERPTSFTLDGVHHEVTEIVDRWYDPDCRYFKVRTVEGKRSLLRHDLNRDRWELVEETPVAEP